MIDGEGATVGAAGITWDGSGLSHIPVFQQGPPRTTIMDNNKLSKATGYDATYVKDLLLHSPPPPYYYYLLSVVLHHETMSRLSHLPSWTSSLRRRGAHRCRPLQTSGGLCQTTRHPIPEQHEGASELSWVGGELVSPFHHQLGGHHEYSDLQACPCLRRSGFFESSIPTYPLLSRPMRHSMPTAQSFCSWDRRDRDPLLTTHSGSSRQHNGTMALANIISSSPRKTFMCIRMAPRSCSRLTVTTLQSVFTQRKRLHGLMRWLDDFPEEYDFDIVYRPGSSNHLVDALFRRPDLAQPAVAGLSGSDDLRLDPAILTTIRQPYEKVPVPIRSTLSGE